MATMWEPCYISRGVWGAARTPGSLSSAMKRRAVTRYGGGARKRSRWGSYIRSGLNAAGSLASAYAAGYSRTSSAKRNVESAPLTDQRDYRVVYRKRRMPKRRKRRYVRSLKRFRSAMLRNEPSRLFQYLYVNEENSGLNTSSYFGAFAGLCANNNYDNNFGEVWNSMTAGSAADLKAQAGRLRVDHMSLRVVLRNITTDIPSGASGTIDIDVYQVICIRDIPISAWPSGTGIESFHVLQKNKMRQAQGMDIEVNDDGTAGIPTLQQNSGTSSSNQAVGDSLWNCPLFMRYWRVLKQFKIQLPVGNTTEFQMRTSKNFTIAREECFDLQQLAAKAWVTRGYVFNINGRPRQSGPGVWEFADVNLCVENYVRYNCKPIVSKAPTLVYDGV